MMAEIRRILVTRAEPGASETAARLTALGLFPVLSPALEIVATGRMPDAEMDGAAGLIFTSANGVRFFAEASARRDLPAWCVGPATSAAARQAGFDEVRNADGDADALFQAIIAAPDAGPLVHVANAHAAGELAARLEREGREVRFCPLYETVPARTLKPAAVTALKSGEIAAILFHSARGAEAFAELAAGYDVSHTAFIAVSAKALSPTLVLKPGFTAIAAQPNEDRLLAALHTALGEG